MEDLVVLTEYLYEKELIENLLNMPQGSSISAVLKELTNLIH